MSDPTANTDNVLHRNVKEVSGPAHLLQLLHLKVYHSWTTDQSYGSPAGKTSDRLKNLNSSLGESGSRPLLLFITNISDLFSKSNNSDAVLIDAK